MNLMIYRQYFAWTDKGVTLGYFQIPGWDPDDWRSSRRMDITPWTIKGPIRVFREGEPVPRELDLIPANSIENPLLMPQHFFVSGMRLGFMGLEPSDHGYGYWVRRLAQLHIGYKVYHESLLHGSLDLGEGLIPCEVAPIILPNMSYKFLLRGDGFDAPRDFSVCGHLHGFMARGVW